jgi:glycosyltransferase involved in cell wall biosynthesis
MSTPPAILFLTTVNLTANPRLLKEVELASRHGCPATVVLFRIGNWGDENDRQLMRRFPGVRFILLSALRRPFGMWLLSSVLERAARLACRFVDLPSVNAMASGKRYLLLRRAVAGLDGRFDWVVAHNPAAFHAALLAARRFGARLGIDVEDYHPAETSDPHLAKALRALLRVCLSAADYVSYASPLIREACDRETARPTGSATVVLNSFPLPEFPVPSRMPAGPLRLVWFSQHVTPGRGLELILPALARFDGQVELHLFGLPDPDFRRRHLEGTPGVFLHGTLPQAELHAALTVYDVGLAIDVLSDGNRDLAVTNKFIAYLQSGLCLAVTDTRAQRRQLAEFPAHGFLFPPDAEAFARLLERLLAEKEQIRSGRMQRYEAAARLDWRVEAGRLLAIWSGSGQAEAPPAVLSAAAVR